MSDDVQQRAWLVLAIMALTVLAWIVGSLVVVAR